MLLSDIRRAVIGDSGVFGADDMIPLPCNPEPISIGYGLRNGSSVPPITSLVPREELVAVDAEHDHFREAAALKDKFIDLFSLSSGPTTPPNGCTSSCAACPRCRRRLAQL